jgi:hypothetical protein
MILLSTQAHSWRTEGNLYQAFLPFPTTDSLHGHHFIEAELRREGVRFRQDDNGLLGTDNPPALQAAPTASARKRSASAWITGRWCWGRSSPKRIAPPSAGGARSRWSTAAISSAAELADSQDLGALWGVGFIPPHRRPDHPDLRGFASTGACAASCTVCWKSSTTAILYCASTARAW